MHGNACIGVPVESGMIIFVSHVWPYMQWCSYMTGLDLLLCKGAFVPVQHARQYMHRVCFMTELQLVIINANVQHNDYRPVTDRTCLLSWSQHGLYSTVCCHHIAGPAAT